jgi:hypothetical protein
VEGQSDAIDPDILCRPVGVERTTQIGWPSPTMPAPPRRSQMVYPGRRTLKWQIAARPLTVYYPPIVLTLLFYKSFLESAFPKLMQN